MFNFKEVTQEQFEIEAKLFNLIKKVVGEIILATDKVIVRLNNSLSFYEQVDLIKEIVSKFNITSMDNVFVE